MTPEQEEHLRRLNTRFVVANTAKYKNGAEEHKTNLWEYSLIDYLYFMRDEAIDQFNYVQTAIEVLEKETND